jgi:predicted RNA-binding protein with RPS1 domain
MQKYPVESKHMGIVRNLTNFGVFIELEPGVDGLIHISDLSWTKKIRHPGEFVKKGDEIEVMVLSIDPGQRRIALGHKQIKDNPWDYFQDHYKIGSETEAKIERIIEKGVIVELPDGVDGFVPVSQLAFAPVKNISEFFNIGDKLPLKVVEFDKEAKKIVLSVVECLRLKDRTDIDIYIAAHPVPNSEKYISDVTSLPKEAILAVPKIEDYEYPEEFDETKIEIPPDVATVFISAPIIEKEIFEVLKPENFEETASEEEVIKELIPIADDKIIEDTVPVIEEKVIEKVAPIVEEPVAEVLTAIVEEPIAEVIEVKVEEVKPVVEEIKAKEDTLFSEEKVAEEPKAAPVEEKPKRRKKKAEEPKTEETKAE